MWCKIFKFETRDNPLGNEISGPSNTLTRKRTRRPNAEEAQIPDEIMDGIIEERLSRADVANGFILDGYPRNVPQAKALDEMLERLGKPIEEALHIDVDPE